MKMQLAVRVQEGGVDGDATHHMNGDCVEVDYVFLEHL